MNEMTSEAYLQAVREYQDAYYTPETIRPHDYRTYQYGLLQGDPEQAMRATNLLQAQRAGVRPGQRVLDAGCGICGPSIDIARHVKGVTIDAVTLSPEQARHGRLAVEDAGLDQRVRVHVGDFHGLPFARETFDVVYYFESFCYAYEQERVLAEALRVLKPGGRLYIKDFFRPASPLSETEAAAFAAMCERYVARMGTLAEAAAAAERVGFAEVRKQDLRKLSEARYRSEWEVRQWIHSHCITDESGVPVLTRFGKRHYDGPRTAPTTLGELQARRPGAAGHAAADDAERRGA